MALKRTLLGWRVEVLKPGNGEDYEIEGITVRTFRTRQLPSNLFPFLFRRWNERSFLTKLHNIGVSLNDVAVCHGHTANFLIYPIAVKGLNPDCKTLLHHHDLASFGLNNGFMRHFWLYNLYLFLVLRKLHEQIDDHVFISEAVKRSFLSAPNAEWTKFADYRRQMRGPRFFNCRSVTIRRKVCLPNGVDCTIFRPEDAVHHDRKFTIGCVGNFTELKDQITLLRALRIIKERGSDVPYVRFVGSGPQLESCRSFVRRNNLDNRVAFEAEIAHKLLPEFYHSIDLFVLPSFFEGFGCVLTEAWACGVPFIACRGQGCEDLIPESDRDRWLFIPRDAEDLSRKILNYRSFGGVQRLNGDVDINALVQNFVYKAGLVGGP